MIYPVRPASEIIITVDVTDAVQVLWGQPVQEAARAYLGLWDHRVHRESLEFRDIPEQLAQPVQLVQPELLANVERLESRGYPDPLVLPDQLGRPELLANVGLQESRGYPDPLVLPDRLGPLEQLVHRERLALQGQ